MTLAEPARARLRLPSIGLVLVGLLAVYMLFNAARALIAPEAFAETLGLPLRDAADTGFVGVYAFRAMFLGLFAAALALRRDHGTLALFALVAVVMPLGDAWLTASAGAEPGIVARHLAIAAVLLVTAGLLQRATGRPAPTGA